MAFPKFPFPKDLPSFIRHEDVLDYLEKFATHYKLQQFIQFNSSVSHVSPEINEGNLSWNVGIKQHNHSGVLQSEQFDAVIVCNGHYSEPLVPDIPGLDQFQGTVLHSHNYRLPNSFKDQTVLVLGANSSGQDISLDIASAAKRVFLGHNKPRIKSPLPENVEQVQGLLQVKEKSVVLRDHRELEVDTILFCTGYRFEFPFLDKECALSKDQERLQPLYKHVIHTRYPTLSFIGIPKTICPFPLFDCQVRFVLAALEGSMVLPSLADMDKDIQQDHEMRLSLGMPERHAHTMGPLQWKYNDELAKLGNFEPIPRVVQILYNQVHEQRVKDLSNYKRKVYQLTSDTTFVEI